MADIKTILVIDDNMFMNELLSEKLSKLGFKIIIANDAKDGLDKVRSEKPAIVILDLLFGDEMTGFEVLQSIRAGYNSKDLPVIILSQIEDQESIDKALALGANDYIIKSYTNLEELSDKVKDISEGKSAEPKSEVVAKSEKVTKLKFIQSKGVRPSEILARELKADIEKSLVSGPSELSIIKLMDNIIGHAYNSRASDVHIDPSEDKLVIRLRIDGILHDHFVLSKTIHSEIITRIKVLSGLRTDEHQAAQDGRFKAKIKTPKIDIDIRVSIAPTYYGENSVMRLLVEQTEFFTLDDLGFSPGDLEKIKKAINKPYGMILSTGPTGSGKTTLLYTILKHLNNRQVSVITIEDPIEYSLEGVDQIQINPRTGLTFADGLRSILRQDPNIIMVGEIRDEETAGIAVNAALTGHLLLSTLHTNDAATTLPRLLDMKVEPFLIASTINVAIGQRLVRKICSECKTPKKITEIEFGSLKESLPKEILSDHHDFFYGKGCKYCEGSGYFGRVGIYEILEVDSEIREAIMRHANKDEIENIAKKNGMTTMLEHGFQKALEGVTTIEEILRVIHE